MALTERLDILINANGSKAVREFNVVGKAATSEMGKATKASSGLAAGLGEVGQMAKAGLATGLAIAASAVAKFAIDGISKFVGYAAEVRNFQRVSGQTAEESSRFVAVLDDMGISANTGAAAISKLIRNVESGKLADFGIDMARTAEGGANATETLLDVADAYAATTDSAERARLRFAAFGKQGDALIPILEKGRAGLKAFFDGVSDEQVMSQAELDKAEDYRLAMDKLGDSVGDVQIAFGLAAAGPVADFASGLAVIIEGASELASKLDDVGDKVPGLLGSIGELFADATIPGLGLVKAIMDVGRESDSLVGSQRAQADAMRDAGAAAEEEAKALDDLANATLASFDAGIAYERSVNNLEDAHADAAEKHRDLNDAIKQFGPRSAEAAAAAEALRRAQLDERAAALGVADAAGKVAEKQVEMAGGTYDATQAIPDQINALAKIRDTLAPGSPLRVALDQYIATLQSLERTYTTTIVAKGASYGGFNFGTYTSDQFFADGGIFGNVPKNAYGNIYSRPTLGVFGEAGPEMILPLSKSKRPQAMALLGKSGLFNGAAMAGGASSASMTTITINMPPGSDGEDVVDAIQRYERRNGKGWRSV